MPKYTLTAGGNAKLLATSDNTTRTVTSLRGLGPETAAQVAHDLGELDRVLPFYSCNDDFLEKLTTLGMRGHDLVDQATGHLTVSRLADAPSPAGRAWQDHVFPIPLFVGRILTAAAQLPDASAKALRTELRTLLAAVDGPVVRARIGGVETVNTINASSWVDQLELNDALNLLSGAFPECVEVEESLVWFHSQPGCAFEGLGNELIAAEVDFYVAFNEKDVIARLAAVRPDLLRSLMRASDQEDLDWDDEGLHAFALETLGELTN